ncbi:hypothetical protein SAMN04488503_2458 [Humidesulfovibrio mexicanus]|uniref:T3SS negative regulator,GrlR n=1 Tax=Humidesulfovibrio mexicanus TaxID=147047 RepID=A0A239B844_9BACT|nr:hypothetical protein [Humidesulfovibrio mexicanus]SNS03323.1 hypothetical protein SAMN04488503_2458 [Humidesulfovibrio mexicanus]
MDGLWTINSNVFGRPSAMVLTFNGGKVTGGNTEYYYVGTYQPNGDSLAGQMTATHYFSTPDPLFSGAKVIPIQFNAKVVNGVLQGTAKAANAPTPITFIGHKVA